MYIYVHIKYTCIHTYGTDSYTSSRVQYSTSWCACPFSIFFGFIYVYALIYIYVYLSTHYPNAHIYIYICIHAYIYMTQIHEQATRKRFLTSWCACSFSMCLEFIYIYVYTYMYIHTYPNTHIHIFTCIHAYIYMTQIHEQAARKQYLTSWCACLFSTWCTPTQSWQ